MAITIARDNTELAPESERPPLASFAGAVFTGGTITWDNSYPTGGEAFDKDAFGLDSVLFAWVQPTDGFVFEYDYANDKVLAYYQDKDAVADSALIQVANASAALNAKVTRIFAIGTITKVSEIA